MTSYYPRVLILIGAILLAAGLLICGILYGVGDMTIYQVNCTVTEVNPDDCVLVRPISGHFTFPYVYNQTPEYVGSKKSCDLVNTLLTCYLYDSVKDGDPENSNTGVTITSVTTNENLARQTDYQLLFAFTITFGVALFFYFIIVCVCACARRTHHKMIHHYDEL